MECIENRKQHIDIMKASFLLSALAVGYAAADDVLYSRRLAKRALDDGGHYNICKAPPNLFSL